MSGDFSEARKLTENAPLGARRLFGFRGKRLKMEGLKKIAQMTENCDCHSAGY
jgi:hypothetical protein